MANRARQNATRDVLWAGKHLFLRNNKVQNKKRHLQMTRKSKTHLEV